MKDRRSFWLSATILILGWAAILTLGWTATYDTSTPAGTDAPSVLDDRIREVKLGVQERQNVDHYWPLAGSQVSHADAGKHRKVTFQEVLGSGPTLTSGQLALYTKTTDSNEAVWLKSDAGTERQLTTGSSLYLKMQDADGAVLKTGNQTVAGVKWFSTPPESDANAVDPNDLMRRAQVDGVTLECDAADEWLQLKDLGVSFAKLGTGGIRMAMGTYTGNGLSSRQITGVGFQPDILMLIDLMNSSLYGWGIKTTAMTGGYSHYSNVYYATQLIASLDADGFTLGTNHPYVNNVDARTYNWIAIEIR